MSFIISHRGAAALAPENTLVSIKAALAAGAKYIEFDVQPTQDGVLVLMHDESLERTTSDNRLVSEISWTDMQELSVSGQPIASLEQALLLFSDAIPVIEGKGAGWAKPLISILTKYHGRDPVVIAYNASELAKVKNTFPHYKTFLINKTNPFTAMRLAKQYGFSGINLLYWLYNPVVYHLAKKLGLQMAAFTVHPRFVKLFHRLYPEVMITVDDPTPWVTSLTLSEKSKASTSTKP